MEPSETGGGVTNASGLAKALQDRAAEDHARLAAAREKLIPLVYIAGPFAGATQYDVLHNVTAAEAIALIVAQAGGLGVCPHTMNRNFFGQLTEEFWLAGVIELLSRCDAAVFTPDYERSRGARSEYIYATQVLKIPTMIYHAGHVGAALMRTERFIAQVKDEIIRSQPLATNV